VRERILQEFRFVVRSCWIGDDQLVFQGTKAGDHQSRVWRLSLADKALVPLTGDEIQVWDVSISKDGKWVIFAGATPPSHDRALWGVPVNGGKIEQLTGTYWGGVRPIRID